MNPVLNDTMELIQTSLKPKGSYNDYLNEAERHNKQFVFVLAHANTGKGAVRSKDTDITQRFPLTESFPMIGEIFQKDETGAVVPRKIRFAQGESSIYVDKQTPDDKRPKKMVRALFKSGYKRVDGAQKHELDFMMNWDANGSKPGRDKNKEILFYLVDNSVAFTKQKEARKLKFEVEKWCNDADFEKAIKPFASLYFTAEQMRQSSDEIRWNLTIMMEKDPAKWKRVLDDPMTERKVVVKRAIDKGYLTVNQNQNFIAWADNPTQPITMAVFGKDVVTDFVEKSHSGDNLRYYQAIEAMVNPKKQPESEIKLEAPAPGEPFKSPLIEDKGLSDADAYALYEQLKAKGLVERKGVAHVTYRGQSFNSKKGIPQELQRSPEFLKLVKLDLSK